LSRAIKVVLTEPVAEQLDELARGVHEPASTVAAQILRHGLAQSVKKGELSVPAPTRAGSSSRTGGERPPWLEPYGGDRDWSALMWGAVAALHGRYPEELATLKDGWWTRSSQAETLAALATWRQEIDDRGHDPREELAFQAELDTFAQRVRGQRGDVGGAWEPGPLP
jgi:hypothetical protein